MARMKQLDFLIRELEKNMPEYSGYDVPDDPQEAFDLFRALCNVRMPGEMSDEFLTVQDACLKEVTEEKGITDCDTMDPVSTDPRLYLWQGDITTLRCDAIVNAANNQMLGCFRPLHNCIDNIIHTMAGVQLRNECAAKMMKLQEVHGVDYKQPTAVPMITSAYNLPAKYVIHVVGPVVNGMLTVRDQEELAACYTNCLNLAAENGCESIAFCCISTGVFMFPPDKAAEIAVSTVRGYLDEHSCGMIKKVIFNVFKDRDLEIYQQALGK